MATFRRSGIAGGGAGSRRYHGAAAIAVCLLLSSVLFGQYGDGERFARVGRGVQYTHERNGDVPWSIHAVKLSRSGPVGFRFASSLAENRIYGLASVAEQVEAVSARWGRAVAAVNGDFFVIRQGPYRGDPAGLQILDGEFVSSPIGTSFWIDSASRPHIGQVTSKFSVMLPDGREIPFGLNQERAEDAAVLYTSRMGESTRTRAGVEFVLERYGDGAWLPVGPDSFCAARVSAANEHGGSYIEPSNMILSVGPKLVGNLPSLRPGTILSLSFETSPSLKGVETAIGGGPVLVSRGEAAKWDTNEYLPRHPRTAIGFNKEHFFLVVVDGRQAGLSAGMTYPELAALMLRLGCEEAMNMDGGGSSTLWLGGRVMNSPSDGRQRRVANALVVVEKR